MTTPQSPWALLRARPPGWPHRVWLAFERPLAVLEALRPGDVPPVLRRAQEEAAAGRWAVGFVAYEAAAAFDPALVTHPRGPLPFAWFGIFERAAERVEPPPVTAPLAALDWSPDVEPGDYRSSIARIHRHIAAGDTYQVNFTWRLETPFDGDPWSLFRHLTAGSPPDHAAYLDTGPHVVASASPELFFRRDGRRLTCRPMKGTMARGRGVGEDRRRALELYDSAKNRAENLMIVDMIRNDLGRVARPGSVRVPSLFDLERHPTVFQLTSTVTAESEAGAADVLAALFPCASVTGAPKVETMKLIADLERGPRGIYTGALGYLAPGDHAEMAVAIRTAWIDRASRRAQYGTGGGIVWDSEADDEYRECLAKTRILAVSEGDFELLETLLWTRDGGYRLRRRHLDRLLASGDYFGFRVSRQRIGGELDRLAATLARSGEDRKVVRLLAGRGGGLRLETRPPTGPAGPWRLALARRPVDPGNRFLFHKTTRREVYDRARAEAPGYDDVLLTNPAGEITETTWANVALRRDGVWQTPPVDAGLLAGCERQDLVERGELEVASLAVSELTTAQDVAVLNSVRGWIAVESVSDAVSGRRIWPPGAGTAAGRNPEPPRP